MIDHSVNMIFEENKTVFEEKIFIVLSNQIRYKEKKKKE